MTASEGEDGVHSLACDSYVKAPSLHEVDLAFQSQGILDSAVGKEPVSEGAEQAPCSQGMAHF